MEDVEHKDDGSFAHAMRYATSYVEEYKLPGARGYVSPSKKEGGEVLLVLAEVVSRYGKEKEAN